MERDALVVFCKLPVPGQVKTRLAAGIGAEFAATFYTHCAQRVVSALARRVRRAPTASGGKRRHAVASCPLSGGSALFETSLMVDRTAPCASTL